ncbi:glycosyl hydrolase family 65 central catalytic domain-containing protein [Myxozyma melibiosi]|uniref:alpha,alpha-trehalase n=1 Tax=Myxozyma melibiosi TaxID=54550 RepID=A0ABR1F053_9ASCO
MRPLAMSPPALFALLLLLLPHSVRADLSRLLQTQLLSDSDTVDAVTGNSSYDTHSWTLSTSRFAENRYQIQPYVSNGYIGIRLPVEGTGFIADSAASKSDSDDDGSETNGWPLFQPRFTGAYVAGFYDLQENTTATNYPELLARGGESVISTVPVWSSLFVSAHGDLYSPGSVDSSRVKNYTQSMSLKDGVVTTRLKWLPRANESLAIWLEYEVIAHREIPTLGMVQLKMSSVVATDVVVVDALDASGSFRTIHLESNFSSVDGTGMWTGVRPYGLKSVSAYEYSHLEFSDENRVNFSTRATSNGYHSIKDYPGTVSQQFRISLDPGETFTVHKYVGIASSDAYRSPKRAAAYTARVAATIGWRLAKADHSLGWKRLWDDSDIVLHDEDQEELQIGVRASLFHLLSAVRDGSEPGGRGDNSVTVSGLSSDSYGGMVFWDADTWMFPSLSVLHPSHASSITNYRQKIHNMSVVNAESYSLPGALYSWTSGRFGNCTATGPCVDYEYHINVDVAQAQWTQFLLSNSTDWLRSKGWPIIRDAADMFAGLVVANGNSSAYYLNNITDPDEYANQVDNGAFTNAGIAKLMNWARRAASVLGEDANEKWADVEEKIYIPVDRSADIVLEFSGMNGSAEVKQADVVMLDYPLEYSSTFQQSLNNLDFYAMAQSPDGPAMTWAIFAINAAELSPSGCASYTYLLSSSQPYLRAPYYQFSEQQADDIRENGGTHPAFPFLTGHGGFLQVFTHGFTGFRAREEAFHLDPSLPPQLGEGGYTVSGMKWRGNVFDVTVALNETTVVLRNSSESSTAAIEIGSGEMKGRYEISAGESLTVPTRRADQNGTLVAGNLAQCQPVQANSTWVKGHFPVSAVDGSISTSWRPATRKPSALVIDLGEDRQATNVSAVEFNWGRVPPAKVSVRTYGAGDWQGTIDEDDGSAYQVFNVTVSAPYSEAEAQRVGLRVGNTTRAELEEARPARWVVVVVEGSLEAEDLSGSGPGATVAEVAIT